MKNNNELQKHKSRDMVKWIIVFVSIIMLATMLTAIITKGFTTADPYGWFEVLKKKDTSGTLQVGQAISFSESVEGLPLYFNRSDEALSKLDAFVNEKISEQTEPFEQLVYFFAGLSNPQLTEPIDFDDDSCFDNTILLCVAIEDDGYYFLGAISSGFEVKEGIILYESEESKEGETQGIEYIAEDGRLLLPVENQREFYVGDPSLYIVEGFCQFAGEELTNTLFATTPFNA